MLCEFHLTTTTKIMKYPSVSGPKVCVFALNSHVASSLADHRTSRKTSLSMPERMEVKHK